MAIDYAETRPELVAGLLSRLERRRDRPPARVVLVVRQAATRRRLEDLFATAGDARDELAVVLRRAEFARLDTDEHQHQLDRAELFERAVAAFANHLDTSGVAPSVPVSPLRAQHFERPLFVLAAALLVATEPETDIAALSADELIAEVLDRHEARYWQRWSNRVALGLVMDATATRQHLPGRSSAASRWKGPGHPGSLSTSRTCPYARPSRVPCVSSSLDNVLVAGIGLRR